jgi:hypothetical protein
MDEAKAKVVVVRPGAAPAVEEIAGFAGVKALLDGAHLERVRLGRYDILCDEDGLRKQLPSNGRLGLVGTFVVTHLRDPDLTSLLEDEIEEVLGLCCDRWADVPEPPAPRKSVEE